MKYTVFVDSNSAYMEQAERYALGEFEDPESAVEACRKVVDQFLLTSWRPGIKADDLFNTYMTFGEDPFIVSENRQCSFSARDYARHRSCAICSD